MAGLIRRVSVAGLTYVQSTTHAFAERLRQLDAAAPLDASEADVTRVRAQGVVDLRRWRVNHLVARNAPSPLIPSDAARLRDMPGLPR